MTHRSRVQEVRLFFAVAVAIGGMACSSSRGPAKPTTAAKAPSAAAVPTHIYVVHAGDSLGAIADCSGVSLDEIARLNRIEDPDRIAAGTQLRLPMGHPCVRPKARPAAPSVARAPVPEAEPERGADPRRAALDAADALLTRATALNDAADFEAALEKAEACSRALTTQCDAKANQVRARCHVVAGMAAAGLDQRARAIEEFRQAFVLDPELKLSAEMTSPRIQELVTSARPRPPSQ